MKLGGELVRRLASAPAYNGLVILALYCTTKALLLACAWVAGFVAERDMSEAFTRLVFLQGKQAPKLGRMTGVMMGTFIGLACLLMIVVNVVMYIASNTPMEILVVDAQIALDVAMAVIVAATIAGSVAATVQNRVYFNYDTEGLRAVRAVRAILTRVLLVTTVLPFACATPPQWIIGHVLRLMQAATPQ